jgi:hypothetical protein
MTTTTLPTSRPVTQDWNQDFQWLNGRFYPKGFYSSIGWKGHNGIDFGCHEGDPVEAVCDGVIEFAGDGNTHPLLTGGGNAILLRNDDLGIRFEYLHLSRFDVKQGQRVTRSQVIARSGNTGISSAPHLHLGAIPVNGVNVNNGYRGRVDPTPYLYGNLNPDYAGSGAIGPQGKITPSEEDDVALTKEQEEALALVPRMKQILDALDERTGNSNTGTLKKAADVILRKINPTDWEDGNTMYIAAQADVRRGTSQFYRAIDGDGSIYELVNGTLRGVSKEEWELRTDGGATYIDTTQARIDKLPKVDA